MQEIPHTINIYETKEVFICLCRFRTWRSISWLFLKNQNGSGIAEHLPACQIIFEPLKW